MFFMCLIFLCTFIVVYIYFGAIHGFFIQKQLHNFRLDTTSIPKPWPAMACLERLEPEGLLGPEGHVSHVSHVPSCPECQGQVWFYCHCFSYSCSIFITLQ